MNNNPSKGGSPEEARSENWSLSGFMGGLPLAGKTGLMIAAGATVLALAAIIWFASRPSYQLLFSGLPEVEAARLVEQLEKMQVPYELAAKGTAVRVPADRVTEVRLELASQGIPKVTEGVGYEIFDQTGLQGMTDRLTNINLQRALQGELARTIEGLASVRSARVHVVLPNRSVFASEEKEASASVTLELANPLKPSQIDGIVHLVSSAVQGLDSSKVTVLDHKGNLLAGGKEDSKDGRMAPDESLTLQRNKEMLLEKNVKTMLDTLLGDPDRSIVRATVELNLDKVERQEEVFDPDRQVVVSEQMVNEQSQGIFGTGGIPGVQPNDPNNTNTAAGGAGSQQSRNVERETKNYGNSKTVNHIRKSVGDIKRISVAVAVDHTLVPSGKPGEPAQWQPRSPEELANLRKMVEQAVGYDQGRGDKIEVLSYRFTPPKPPEEPISPWLTPDFQLEMAKYLVFAILVFLLVFFVMRPLVKTLLLPEKLDEDALPGTVAELERRLMAEGVGTMPSEQPTRMVIPDRTMQLAQQMINDNLEEAREILRSWMAEGG
ncbi:MAG: flagellar M-ring protein FliF [Magnetococcales bacterium]|nr:flagellar M-ring protein FliF [Magnetococcales bacterium]